LCCHPAVDDLVKVTFCMDPEPAAYASPGNPILHERGRLHSISCAGARATRSSRQPYAAGVSSGGVQRHVHRKHLLDRELHEAGVERAYHRAVCNHEHECSHALELEDGAIRPGNDILVGLPSGVAITKLVPLALRVVGNAGAEIG